MGAATLQRFNEDNGLAADCNRREANQTRLQNEQKEVEAEFDRDMEQFVLYAMGDVTEKASFADSDDSVADEVYCSFDTEELRVLLAQYLSKRANKGDLDAIELLNCGGFNFAEGMKAKRARRRCY